MHNIVKLFLSFFKIGAFSFGGGYAMLPLMKETVIDQHKWLTNSEFIDIGHIGDDPWSYCHKHGYLFRL